MREPVLCIVQNLPGAAPIRRAATSDLSEVRSAFLYWTFGGQPFSLTFFRDTEVLLVIGQAEKGPRITIVVTLIVHSSGRGCGGGGGTN